MAKYEGLIKVYTKIGGKNDDGGVLKNEMRLSASSLSSLNDKVMDVKDFYKNESGVLVDDLKLDYKGEVLDLDFYKGLDDLMAMEGAYNAKLNKWLHEGKDDIKGKSEDDIKGKTTNDINVKSEDFKGKTLEDLNIESDDDLLAEDVKLGKKLGLSETDLKNLANDGKKLNEDGKKLSEAESKKVDGKLKQGFNDAPKRSLDDFFDESWESLGEDDLKGSTKVADGLSEVVNTGVKVVKGVAKGTKTFATKVNKSKEFKDLKGSLAYTAKDIKRKHGETLEAKNEDANLEVAPVNLEPLKGASKEATKKALKVTQKALNKLIAKGYKKLG